MIRNFHLLFLILSVHLLNGQHFLPDSIKQKFTGHPENDRYVDQLNVVASGYLRTDPDLTRIISSHTIEVASKIKYTRGYARALTVMGNAYWYEGVYEFAQKYYLLAARQYQSINDSVGLGYAYNNIGEVYKKLNDNEKALEYLFRSMELKKKDSASHALTLYNIAESYLRLDKIAEAKDYIERSMKIASDQQDNRVIAFNYWGLGAIRLKEKKYQEALEFYFRAEEIWTNLGEVRSLIQTYQEIAEVYSQQHHYANAEKYLTRALQLATKIKVPDLQINNYLRFSRLDSVRGNYARALHFLGKHNVLKDSVYNIIKSEQIVRLQTIYETELRDRENQQLRSAQEVKNSQLRFQSIIIATITFGLVLAGILSWFLYQQRLKILLQKKAIELQATSLTELNAELRTLNKNLEARIIERTNQLTIQNQRLTEYTFINAHKLRAPVASILGLINLLQQVAPEEKEAILTHLKTCGEQLDKIIRELSKTLEAAIIQEK